MKIAKLFRAIWVAAACLLLNACFEIKQEFTLNPDGSGKVVMDATFPQLTLTGDQKQDDAALKKAVAEFLEESEGIEAWKDVSYEWTDDGRIHFVGTGYFTDLSAIKFDNVGLVEFAWKKTGQNGQLSMSFSENEDAADPPPVATDPDKRAEEIKAERAKFKQSKAMMAGFMGTMSHRATFTLPGKAGKTHHFKTADDGKISLKVTGSQMLDAMEKLVNDDEWMATNSFNVENGPSDTAALNAALFGSKDPAIARRTAVSKPLFPYARELAEAKKAYATLEETLGTKIGPAATGEPFESLEVVGLRVISDVDGDFNFQPFNSQPGISLSLLGEFSGSVLEVTNESILKKAIASDGTDLLPTNKFNRQIDFARLSKNRTKVLFEVELKPTDQPITGLKELSGTIQYVVAQGTKEVDLGFPSIEQGKQGDKLSAKIKTVKEGWRKNGSEEMEIEIDIKVSELKELILVDGGKRITLEKRGHSSFGNKAPSFNFESKKAFPKNAVLIAVLHDKIETYDIPFKLEDYSLLDLLEK